MAEKLLVQLEDSVGNIYYLHTSADVVFCEDGISVQTKLAQKIEKADIIQNATTASTTKVVSASVAKNLQDQINEQNTKIGNRIVTSRYFAGTYNNTSYVFVSLSDMGITGKKLHQFPSILATLNTDVNGMYIEKAFRNSDESIAIIFNKAYSGSFIIALSFDIVDA